MRQLVIGVVNSPLNDIQEEIKDPIFPWGEQDKFMPVQKVDEIKISVRLSKVIVYVKSGMRRLKEIFFCG